MTIATPEPMAAFFDARAEGYDSHIQNTVFSEATFHQFYNALISPIEQTDAPIKILDLGCGTGLEIEPLLKRAPNALITAVDVAEQMLTRLEERYQDQMDQITLVVDSYLTMPFPAKHYDYVISAMTIHHLLHDAKLDLYQKIKSTLKPGGKYIEGDTVTTAALEGEFLAEYIQHVEPLQEVADGAYHIDVPLSLDTQKELLLSAGFKNFALIWQLDSTAEWNHAVYVAST